MLALLLTLCACQLGLEPTHSAVTGGDSGAFGGDSGFVGGNCDDSDADGDGVDECGGDCDDDDPFTYPGAAASDSGSECMTDNDGDGYGDADPAGGVTPGSDCDDLNPSRSPGAEEVPFDGVDSDCDGEDGGTSISADGQSNVTINDYDTSTSAADVSGCREIYDISVDVEIIHSFIGDLTVTLISPSGTSAVLHDGTGSAKDNIVGTYAVGSTGSLSPAQPLSRFLGESGNGAWRMTVYDDAFNDSGRIASWTLNLECP